MNGIIRKSCLFLFFPFSFFFFLFLCFPRAVRESSPGGERFFSLLDSVPILPSRRRRGRRGVGGAEFGGLLFLEGVISLDFSWFFERNTTCSIVPIVKRSCEKGCTNHDLQPLVEHLGSKFCFFSNKKPFFVFFCFFLFNERMSR